VVRRNSAVPFSATSQRPVPANGEGTNAAVRVNEVRVQKRMRVHMVTRQPPANQPFWRRRLAPSVPPGSEHAKWVPARVRERTRRGAVYWR